MPEPNFTVHGLLELLFESKEHWAVLNVNEGSYTLAESREDAQAKAKVGDFLVHNTAFKQDHGRTFHMFPVI